MNNRFGILAMSTFVTLLAIAQIPELDIIKSNSSSSKLAGIEKARAAFYNGENQLAETLFFTELEANNLEGNDYLLFANSLVRDNKPALAKEFYNTYFSQNPNKKQQKEQLSAVLSKNVEELERVAYSKNDVVSPTLYQDKLYGTKSGKVYSYTFDCEQNIENKTEQEIATSGMIIGSISYINDGNSAVASFLNSKSGKFGLYLLQNKNGKWSSPSKLAVDKAANFAFPMVDEKNSVLYFASDKAGIFGGYDLYKSILNEKSIETPLNLGENINSAGNEIFPYKGENWLYFSTNGYLSKGGYDIYKFKELSDNNFILQNYLIVNTSDDDLACLPFSQEKCIVGHMQKNSYVISSLEKSKKAMFVKGRVLDVNGEPIKDAKLLFELDENLGKYVSTDKDGEYIFTSETKQVQLFATVLALGYEQIKVDVIKDSDIILAKKDENTEQVITYIDSYHTDPPPVNYKATTETTTVTKKEITKTTASTEAEISPNQPLVYLPEVSGPHPQKLDQNKLYYIIIGSAANEESAQNYLLKWIGKFENLQIMSSENGRYRIGFFAGLNEREANEAYVEARKVKS